MKLQDILISIGLFAVFTIVIFGFINPNNKGSIYNEKYLNVSHDALTQKTITNITTVGETTNEDFSGISGDAKNYTGSTDYEERTESNIIKGAINFLVSLPSAYKPFVNVLRMLTEKFGIDPIFQNWLMNSIIIIIILIIITAIVKNKLET